MRKADALLHFLTVTLGLTQCIRAQNPQVQIGRTTLVGRAISSSRQEYFGNIPYAEPPIGQLRFTPPVLKDILPTGEFDARTSGVACPQEGLSYVNEDCLTLNVLRPPGLSNRSRLPVMVYIHGGGFYEGSGINTDGAYIVSHSVSRGTPVLFISLNYRLGALGFPQGIEASRRKALNLGLRDQRAALEWIQRSIHNFGGDRSKVFVFGSSAGSVSVGELLLSPDFGRLAHGASMHSGSASTAFIFPGERRENLWQTLVSRVPECNGVPPTSGRTFDCLRRANSSTIFAASEYIRQIAPEWFPFWPNVDGPGGLIPDLPSKLFKKGHFSRIPFIAGTCLDEGTIFTPPTFNSTGLLRQWIITNSTPSDLGPEVQNQVADRLLELYPDIPSEGSPYNTGNETFGLSSQFKRAAAFNGDMGLHAVRKLWAQAATRAGVRGYAFLFTDPQPQWPAFLGVGHGLDMAYIFGQTDAAGGTGPVAELSRNMMDYWISFAVSLDPNDTHGNTSRPRWEMYSPKNGVIMEFNNANLSMIRDDFRAEKIDYINSEPAVLVLRH